MKAKAKRKLKKQYKVFVILSYSCVIFSILFFIFMLTTHIKTNTMWGTLIVLSIFLFPLFLGLSFATFASYYRVKLHTYKKRIQIYRSRRFAIRTIKYLENGELNNAINEYQKHTYVENDLSNYVYGMIIMNCYLSTVKYSMGLKKIEDLKESYNPDKINLDNIII